MIGGVTAVCFMQEFMILKAIGAVETPPKIETDYLVKESWEELQERWRRLS